MHISADFSERNILWKFTPDLGSWSLSYVPTAGFGLAVYNSQLVLVGGRDSYSEEVCSKLWTSDGGLRWTEGELPAMLAPRHSPLVVSFGSPECLLVAGGNHSWCNSVEVFANGEWSLAEPLPHRFTSWYSTMHNGNLYLSQTDSIIYCNLGALLKHSRRGVTSVVNGVWRELKRPCDGAVLVSLKGQLLALSSSCSDCRVYAYSPCQQCWVHVGVSHLPGSGISLRDSVAVSLPTGSYLILRMESYPETRAFKISSEGEQW